MWRPGWLDESGAEIFFNEVAECLQLRLGERVDWSPQRRCALFQVDLEIIRPMRSKGVGLGFTKNVSELMMFGGDVGEVNRFLHQLRLVSGSRFGEIREMNVETL